MNKGSVGKCVWKVVKCIVGTVLVLCALLVLYAAFGTIPVQFANLLFLGWITYLGRVLPQMTFNPEIAFDAVVALVLAVFGLHRILSWWVRQGGGEPAPWRLDWTVKISVMVLLLFATSIAAVGMVHQIGWLCREPRLIVMTGLGKETRELSNLKQVVFAMRMFAEDHAGRFPNKLDDLVPDYLVNIKLFYTRGVEGDPPQPIIYNTGYGIHDDPATIILESPRPFEWPRGRTRVVAHLDSSAVVIPEAKFQELIQKQQASPRGK